ncbi:hypothetical protein QTG54_002183 [Skeletonema marinoi]|uniref:Uncharacterized protein n=1 Tax=Skeletonema marinoi TaxID=267567 RepID=A0AAD8YJU0_9STRA|nr:hypothetical protein QTG54_002183 [Skeletonema marinoi]
MTSNCRERERQEDVAPAASQKRDNKLKTCTAWKSVRYCNMLHARRSIDQNTNDHERKDSLNYMTKFCTSSLLAATMVIAPLFIALSATDPSSSIAMACCSNMICVGSMMPIRARDERIAASNMSILATSSTGIARRSQHECYEKKEVMGFMRYD